MVGQIIASANPYLIADCSSLESGWKEIHLDEDGSIPQVSRSHAGHFRCRASNGLEPAIETDFQLLVQGMNFHCSHVEKTCFTRHWVLSVHFSRNEALFRMHCTSRLNWTDTITRHERQDVYSSSDFTDFTSTSINSQLWVFFSWGSIVDTFTQPNLRSWDFNFHLMWRSVAESPSLVTSVLAHLPSTLSGSRMAHHLKTTLIREFSLMRKHLVSPCANCLSKTLETTLAMWRTEKEATLIQLNCWCGVS